MRPLLLVTAAAFLAAGCGSSAATVTAPPPATQTFAGGGLNPPRPAPPLALRDSRTGQTVTLAAQRGRYTLVTFLYVHCPDVCPLIAQNLNAALRALPKAQRAQVRVFAVSVDPKGDTPAAVRAYVQQHELPPEFRYLLGTTSQLRTVWAAWHVLAVQQTPALVDHVAYTALVDRSGKERVLYGAQVQAHQVLHDLRLLMRPAKA